MNLTENSKKRIRFIWRIVTSVLLVLTGILFMVSCYSIYKSGEQPFTRESIADAFSKIAVFVYITLVSVFSGIIFEIIYPEEEKKLIGKRTDALVMQKLYSKVDHSELSADANVKIEREEKLRHIMKHVNVALVVLSVILPLIYLLNPKTFPASNANKTPEISRAILVYLATLLPVFIYEIVYVIVSDRSVKREITILREASVKHPAKNVEKTEKSGGVLRKMRDFIVENNKSIVLGIRIGLVICSVGFIIAGITNGGMNEILKKAVKICSECIGLA